MAGHSETDEEPFPGSAADFYERIQLLKAENASLRGALELVDDHGRALAAFEMISKLNHEVEELRVQRREDVKVIAQLIIYVDQNGFGHNQSELLEKARGRLSPGSDKASA